MEKRQKYFQLKNIIFIFYWNIDIFYNFSFCHNFNSAPWTRPDFFLVTLLQFKQTKLVCFSLFSFSVLFPSFQLHSAPSRTFSIFFPSYLIHFQARNLFIFVFSFFERKLNSLFRGQKIFIARNNFFFLFLLIVNGIENYLRFFLAPFSERVLLFIAEMIMRRQKWK